MTILRNNINTCCQPSSQDRSRKRSLSDPPEVPTISLNNLELPPGFRWDDADTHEKIDQAESSGNISHASSKTLIYSPKRSFFHIIIALFWDIIFCIFITFLAVKLCTSLMFIPILLVSSLSLAFIAVGIDLTYSSIMGRFGSVWFEIASDTIRVEKGLRRKGKTREFPRNDQTQIVINVYRDNQSRTFASASSCELKFANGSRSYLIIKDRELSSEPRQLLEQIMYSHINDL